MAEFNNYRTLQVELWEDCNYRCPFCYLGDNRRLTTPEQKLVAIQKTNDILNSLDDKYDAFGIIGGEFFDNQLSTTELKSSFLCLIHRLDRMVDLGIFKQIWVTSALLSDVSNIFNYLFSDLKHKDKFLICTSYDTSGRFTTTTRDIWFKNISYIRNCGFKVHIQVILTSDFIEEALTTDILDVLSCGNMLDFKTPTPHRDEYIDSVLNKGDKNYRDIIQENMSKFSESFFINDRDKFLEFIIKIKDKFGKEKVEAFCSNKVRSDKLHLISKDIIIKDRWSDGIENAPCGHPWDSYCYKYEDKCARCDALNILDGED